MYRAAIMAAPRVSIGGLQAGLQCVELEVCTEDHRSWRAMRHIPAFIYGGLGGVNGMTLRLANKVSIFVSLPPKGLGSLLPPSNPSLTSGTPRPTRPLSKTMDVAREVQMANAGLGASLQAATKHAGLEAPAFRSIPVVDLGPSFSGSLAARISVAREIQAACVTSGFFYLKNHGMPPGTCKEVLALVHRFFSDMSVGQKRKLHFHQSPLFRGWRPPEKLLLDRAEEDDGGTSAETKEAFNFGYQAELDPTGGDGQYRELDGSKASANLWPDEADLPGFFDGIKNFYGRILQLSKHLLQIFALSLDLPETYFDSMATHPGGIARLLYYAASPATESRSTRQQTIGIRPHCDFEFFTLLVQSHHPGLQVLSPDGHWVDGDPIEGCLVVNIGELMTRVTNGLYKSTIHQVVNKSSEARYSVPFFFSVNYDTIVEPLQTCISAERPARYGPIRVDQYIIERLKLAIKQNE
ncbi:hypothetical protein F4680DRAFT_70291 [Xylaria scruposa]|nr:hypothetical protein F4680DRAFT_70291 [Xylaria scruposa]